MSEGDSANAPGKIHPTFPTPKLDVGRSVCQFGPNFRPLDHSWAQTSWPQFPLSLSINCDVFPAPRGRASTSCRPTRSTCPCWRTPRTPSAKRKVQSLSVVFDTVTSILLATTRFFIHLVSLYSMLAPVFRQYHFIAQFGASALFLSRSAAHFFTLLRCPCQFFFAVILSWRKGGREAKDLLRKNFIFGK